MIRAVPDCRVKYFLLKIKQERTMDNKTTTTTTHFEQPVTPELTERHFTAEDEGRSPADEQVVPVHAQDITRELLLYAFQQKHLPLLKHFSKNQIPSDRNWLRVGEAYEKLKIMHDKQITMLFKQDFFILVNKWNETNYENKNASDKANDEWKETYKQLKKELSKTPSSEKALLAQRKKARKDHEAQKPAPFKHMKLLEFKIKPSVILAVLRKKDAQEVEQDFSTCMNILSLYWLDVAVNEFKKAIESEPLFLDYLQEAGYASHAIIDEERHRLQELLNTELSICNTLGKTVFDEEKISSRINKKIRELKEDRKKAESEYAETHREYEESINEARQGANDQEATSNAIQTFITAKITKNLDELINLHDFVMSQANTIDLKTACLPHPTRENYLITPAQWLCLETYYAFSEAKLILPKPLFEDTDVAKKSKANTRDFLLFLQHIGALEVFAEERFTQEEYALRQQSDFFKIEIPKEENYGLVSKTPKSKSKNKKRVSLQQPEWSKVEKSENREYGSAERQPSFLNAFTSSDTDEGVLSSDGSMKSRISSLGSEPEPMDFIQPAAQAHIEQDPEVVIEDGMAVTSHSLVEPYSPSYAKRNLETHVQAIIVGQQSVGGTLQKVWQDQNLTYANFTKKAPDVISAYDIGEALLYTYDSQFIFDALIYLGIEPPLSWINQQMPELHNWTLLHLAVFQKNWDFVVYLVKRGAKLDIEDNYHHLATTLLVDNMQVIDCKLDVINARLRSVNTATEKDKAASYNDEKLQLLKHQTQLRDVFVFLLKIIQQPELFAYRNQSHILPSKYLAQIQSTIDTIEQMLEKTNRLLRFINRKERKQVKALVETLQVQVQRGHVAVENIGAFNLLGEAKKDGTLDLVEPLSHIANLNKEEKKRLNQEIENVKALQSKVEDGDRELVQGDKIHLYFSIREELARIVREQWDQQQKEKRKRKKAEKRELSLKQKLDAKQQVEEARAELMKRYKQGQISKDDFVVRIMALDNDVPVRLVSSDSNTSEEQSEEDVKAETPEASDLENDDTSTQDTSQTYQHIGFWSDSSSSVSSSQNTPELESKKSKKRGCR